MSFFLSFLFLMNCEIMIKKGRGKEIDTCLPQKNDLRGKCDILIIFASINFKVGKDQVLS